MAEDNITITRHFGAENLEKLMKDIVLKRLNSHKLPQGTAEEKCYNISNSYTAVNHEDKGVVDR